MGKDVDASPVDSEVRLPVAALRCYRSVCKQPNATWYNSSTHAWYCRSCALKINQWNPGLCVEGKSAGVRRSARELQLEAEIKRLTELIDTPHTADFMEAVPLEAAHQLKRWGVEHDDGKAPEDWFWLIGYLAGKCLHAAKTGDIEKAKHHTISTAAVMLNWHRRLTGDDETFRPGIAPDLINLKSNP